ncbi:hypothetical protein KRP22_003735 [Phytophthora ramorum]|nr:F-box protein [Phytophthora ramorum]
MDSHSSTHSKSAAIRSPLTSSLDEQGSTPSASSSYFIEGPWEQRNRRFQNVLLHVCSFILILEFAERVSYYGINQGLKNFMGKLGWSQGNCAFSYEARMLYYGLVAFGAAFPLNLLASFLSDWLSVGQYLSYFVVLCSMEWTSPASSGTRRSRAFPYLEGSVRLNSPRARFKAVICRYDNYGGTMPSAASFSSRRSFWPVATRSQGGLAQLSMLYYSIADFVKVIKKAQKIVAIARAAISLPLKRCGQNPVLVPNRVKDPTRSVASMATKKARVRKAHDGIRLSSLSPEKRVPGATWDQLHTVAELATVFAYKEIPDEVLVGTDLDLSTWSVVANDSCLMKLSCNPGGLRMSSPARLQYQSNQLAEFLPSAVSAATAMSMNGAASIVLPKQQPIVRLNLAGADQITDKTAHLIAIACPHLKSLSLERAFKLTDSGILHIISCCRSLESLNLSYVTALQSPALSCIGELRIPLRTCHRWLHSSPRLFASAGLPSVLHSRVA